MDLPHGINPRSGDAWVYGPDGQRMWGRYGAAGLALVHPQRGILLQHRAVWSHHGGTWGIPGGARDRGESAVDAALRESHEELTVPQDAAGIVASRVLDLGFWTYTTVVAQATTDFEPKLNDAESADARWVPLGEIHELPLHPGFAASLEDLDAVLRARPVLVVDVANVMGSVPDGWWRDRVGSARELVAGFAALAASGVAAELLNLPLERVWPRFILVVEGEAKQIAEDALPDVSPSLLTVRAAAGSGDDEIVAMCEQLRVENPRTYVALASADRELQQRANADAVVSPRALRELLDSADLQSAD